MAVTTPPIKPLNLHAKKYDAELRRRFLRPLFDGLETRLEKAHAAVGIELRKIHESAIDPALDKMTHEAAAKHLQSLDAYHRRRMQSTIFRRIGIDGSKILADPRIKPIMEKAIRDNVALIRKLEEQTRKGLADRIIKNLQERPFDRQMLQDSIRTQAGIAGRRLKVITRDQTNKAIGQLTKARHEQIGITSYVWSSSEDERVRETHLALSGTIQRWDSPSSEGHPGDAILCRCVAIPILPDPKDIPPAQKAAIEDPAITAPAAPPAGKFGGAEYREPDFAKLGPPEPLGKFSTSGGADGDWALAEKAHRGAANRLTRDQIPPGLEDYRQQGYKHLMESFRKQEFDGRATAMLDDIAKHTKTLDDEFVLWRGYRKPKGFKTEWDDLVEGAVFEVKTPASTSLDKSKALDFAKGATSGGPSKAKAQTIIRYRAGKNTKGIIYSEAEHEILLAPGHIVRVDKIEFKVPLEVWGKAKGEVQRIVHVTILEQNPQAATAALKATRKAKAVTPKLQPKTLKVPNPKKPGKTIKQANPAAPKEPPKAPAPAEPTKHKGPYEFKAGTDKEMELKHFQDPDYRPMRDIPPETRRYFEEGGTLSYRDVRADWADIGRLRPETHEMVTDLRRYMRPTRADRKVYRGAQQLFDSPDAGNYAIFRNAKPGDIIGEGLPTSTSANQFQPMDTFARVSKKDPKKAKFGTMMEIDVPKGTRALITNEAEAEVLLDANYVMRVKEVRKNVKVKYTTPDGQVIEGVAERVIYGIVEEAPKKAL